MVLLLVVVLGSDGHSWSAVACQGPQSNKASWSGWDIGSELSFSTGPGQSPEDEVTRRPRFPCKSRARCGQCPDFLGHLALIPCWGEVSLLSLVIFLAVTHPKSHVKLMQGANK